MAGVIEELATPFLAVEVDVLDRNVAALAARARDARVAMRSHAKTHKCVEIARRQLDAAAVGLSVATLAEAEVFAAAGFEDPRRPIRPRRRVSGAPSARGRSRWRRG